MKLSFLLLFVLFLGGSKVWSVSDSSSPSPSSSLFSKGTKFLKKEKASVVQQSPVVRQLIQDGHTVSSGLQSAQKNLSHGKVLSALEAAGGTWQAGLDLATAGESTLAINMAQGYGSSINDALHGRQKKALKEGQNALMDTFRFVEGPGLNMVAGPRNTQEILQQVHQVRESGKTLTQEGRQLGYDLLQKKEFKADKFQKLVQYGAQFQNDSLDLLAKSSTNTDVGRKVVKGVGNYFNGAMQEMGQGMVDETKAIREARKGQYKQALKETGNALLNTAEGGGKLVNAGVTGLQVASWVVPALAPLEIPIAIVGTAGNMAANSKVIVKGVRNSSKDIVHGIQDIKAGDKKKGTRELASGAGHAAAVAGVITMGAVGGGAFGKPIGKAIGAQVLKGVERGAHKIMASGGAYAAEKAGALQIAGKVGSVLPKSAFWAGSIGAKQVLRGKVSDYNKKAEEVKKLISEEDHD